jgi:hypothetical protein
MPTKLSPTKEIECISGRLIGWITMKADGISEEWGMDDEYETLLAL